MLCCSSKASSMKPKSIPGRKKKNHGIVITPSFAQLWQSLGPAVLQQKAYNKENKRMYRKQELKGWKRAVHHMGN